ncbi:MAG: phosphotransferase family protein [Thermomicrobiales bacterium]
MTDTDRPLEILAALGVTAPGSVTPVTGGADTEIWKVEHDGLVSALRVMRPEQQPIAKIERAAMTAASAVLPVPEVRASTIWNEHPAMLIEWMPGKPLLHEVVADLRNAGSWGRLLGEAQARLHEVSAPAGIPAVADSWLGQLNPELPPDAVGQQLLHCDFHPLNVLVNDGQVSGVIDWSNAASGDPRLDVARTWAILELVEITFPNLDQKSSRFVLSEFSRGWREAYEEARGRRDLDIDLFLQWGMIATARDFGNSARRKTSESEAIQGIREVLTGLVDVLKVIT